MWLTTSDEGTKAVSHRISGLQSAEIARNQTRVLVLCVRRVIGSLMNS